MHRHVPIAAGVGLSIALVAAAAALRPEVAQAEPVLTVVGPGDLPAPGVTLWCGWFDPLAGPTHKARLPRVWVRGVSDSGGRLRFAGDPEDCVLRGDGVTVLGDREVSIVSGAARASVVPSFRCESALVAVERDADWLLAWYRAGTGFRGLRAARAPALLETTRQLWREEGERRDRHDLVRDCALVVATSRIIEATQALGALTRPFAAGHFLADGQPEIRDTEYPALDVRVWTAGALCSWVDHPLPGELAAALPDESGCRPR